MDYKTYAEISTQFTALQKTVKHILNQQEELRSFLQNSGARKLLVLGCGSSFSVGKSIEGCAEMVLGLESVCIPAGDFMLNASEYRKIAQDSLILALSRSGETHEVINAIQESKHYFNSKVLSVVCAEKTTLGKISDYTIELPWAFDEGVCQTRSVTNLFAACRLVLSVWEYDQGAIEDISKFALEGDGFIQKVEPLLKDIANEEWENAFVLADGEIAGVAEEAALALTEIAFTPSHYKHLLDVRHGPILLVDVKTLVIALTSGDEKGHQKVLIEDLVNRGAKVIVLHTSKYEHVTGTRIEVELNAEHATSVVAGFQLLVTAQLLAYHKSLAKGLNPDQPKGLDAWIRLDGEED